LQTYRQSQTAGSYFSSLLKQSLKTACIYLRTISIPDSQNLYENKPFGHQKQKNQSSEHFGRYGFR
ncbi:hypothetical protein, partial [Anoxybacillus sp. EFIL]|uniref:hypothetical protein n=1 Tax=Anoxybacillus sp. EFIL TaxID=2508869 RepID=UPI001C0EFD6E